MYPGIYSIEGFQRPFILWGIMNEPYKLDKMTLAKKQNFF